MITLKNETDFIVLDVGENGLEGLPSMPEGYVKTKIQVDGIEIPSYTLENDLENDFILLYLQGPNGEKGIYRYDRKEKTIQRYAEDTVQKTVKGVSTSTENSDGSGHIVYIVIIGVLILMLLGALIAMLRMVSEGKKKDIG